MARRGEFQFGQPEAGLVQMAYVVPDLERAIEQFSSRFRMGPWYVRGPFIPPEGEYRGERTEVELSLARSWNGHVMIELIHQHNDKPSVYRETVEARGYGFHHFAIATRDFDGELARYRSFGYEVVFSDRTPSGRRVVYVDAIDMPGMIEVIEVTDAHERFYASMWEACRHWDGSRPIRHDEELHTEG